MGTASGLGTQHMSEAVNETGVTINHAQYIRNPRCGNLLEEGIVDQMMFAGRRRGARSVYPADYADDIPVQDCLPVQDIRRLRTNGYPIPWPSV